MESIREGGQGRHGNFIGHFHYNYNIMDDESLLLFKQHYRVEYLNSNNIILLSISSQHYVTNNDDDDD
jgi:hypothetical protein